MKYLIPYIVVFTISLVLCIYNIAGPITIPLIIGIILISCFWSLLGGTVVLFAMRLAKGI